MPFGLADASIPHVDPYETSAQIETVCFIFLNVHHWLLAACRLSNATRFCLDQAHRVVLNTMVRVIPSIIVVVLPYVALKLGPARVIAKLKGKEQKPRGATGQMIPPRRLHDAMRP